MYVLQPSSSLQALTEQQRLKLSRVAYTQVRTGRRLSDRQIAPQPPAARTRSERYNSILIQRSLVLTASLAHTTAEHSAVREKLVRQAHYSRHTRGDITSLKLTSSLRPNRHHSAPVNPSCVSRRRASTMYLTVMDAHGSAMYATYVTVSSTSAYTDVAIVQPSSLWQTAVRPRFFAIGPSSGTSACPKQQ